MWWWVDIALAGLYSVHGGDGKKSLAVSFGGDRGSSGVQ